MGHGPGGRLPALQVFRRRHRKPHDNLLDRHVAAAAGNRLALIWEGEDGSSRFYTYRMLAAEVNRCANVLKRLGVTRGDAVGVFTPNLSEPIVAVLACLRIGALFNTVFSGFSARSLRDRLESYRRRVIVTADGGFRRGAGGAAQADRAPGPCTRASRRPAFGPGRRPVDDRVRPEIRPVWGRTPANPPGEGLITDVPLTIDPFIPIYRHGDRSKTPILDAARTTNADLIVMTSDGRNGFLDALRGSHSERLLRRSPCPLLVIPETAFVTRALKARLRPLSLAVARHAGATRPRSTFIDSPRDRGRIWPRRSSQRSGGVRYLGDVAQTNGEQTPIGDLAHCFGGPSRHECFSLFVCLWPSSRPSLSGAPSRFPRRLHLRQPPPPAAALTADQLAGTWNLVSIQPTGQGEQLTPLGANYTLSFATGRLSTRADCNSCSAAFTVSGQTLTAGPAMACTRAACPTMAFENVYTSLLSGESTATVSARALVLSSDRGLVALREVVRGRRERAEGAHAPRAEPRRCSRCVSRLGVSRWGRCAQALPLMRARTDCDVSRSRVALAVAPGFPTAPAAFFLSRAQSLVAG